MTIRVSSSTPRSSSASTIRPTCLSAFFATNGMWRISSIEPGSAPFSPRSSGPHMWPILSMAPRLTIMPRQFEGLLISSIAALADQLSPPMWSGSKPGTKRFPSSG